MLPSFPEVALQGKVSLDINLRACFHSTFGTINGKMLNLMPMCLIDGKLDCGQGWVDFSTSVLWIICLSEKRENPVNPSSQCNYPHRWGFSQNTEIKQGNYVPSSLWNFIMLNLSIWFVLVGAGGVFRGLKLFLVQICQISCAFSSKPL